MPVVVSPGDDVEIAEDDTGCDCRSGFSADGGRCPSQRNASAAEEFCTWASCRACGAGGVHSTGERATLGLKQSN